MILNFLSWVQTVWRTGVTKKSKAKFCNLSVMMFSVWWIWKLKLQDGTNEMARDKIVKIDEMKCEDPFCIEWYWNLYRWLACDILVEIWNMKYEIKIGSSVWTEPVDRQSTERQSTDRHFNAANTVIAGSSVCHQTLDCSFRKQKFLSLTPL